MQTTIAKHAAVILCLCAFAGAEGQQTAPAATTTNVAVDVSPAAVTPRTATRPAAADADGFVERWLSNRLEIGLRFAQVKLDDPTREDGFVGTINELSEDRSSLPYNVVLGLRCNSYLGMNMMWDSLRAKTHTTSDNRHSDGAFTDDGPTFTLVGSYPLPHGVTPYVECGLHLVSADFDAEQWWALGYASPSSHASLGSPGVSRGGLRRYMETESDSATGFAWGLGLLIALSEHCRLDLAVRHVEADGEAHFYIKQGGQMLHDRGLHSIPLSYTAYCVGMRYAF
jgi:opacity protein-like surface antigen